jgi:hypothetical protein
MSYYIEIKLASGLNRVLYKYPYVGIKVKPDTQLFIKNDFDNDYTPIGTLAEVRVASGFGTLDIKTKDKIYIDTIGMMSGKINIKLFAKPPSNTVGGKIKTRKYKRINKRKTRKYKKR